MTFPFGETVVLHRTTITGPDAWGNDVLTSTDTTHKGVAIYSKASVELVQGQDLSSDGLVVVFRPAVVVAATDRITLRGALYEVDGSPSDLRSPFTGSTVTEVQVKLVTG